MKYGLILLFMFPFGRIFAAEKPIIQQIDFSGNQIISSSLLKQWFAIDKNTPFNPDDLPKNCTRLLQEYAKAGFPYARIDSLIFRQGSDSLDVSLSLYLNEGSQLVTGAVSFSGLTEQEVQDLDDLIDIPSGKSLNVNRLDEKLEDSVTSFEKKGYPFVQLVLQSIQLDSSSSQKEAVNFHYKVVKGPQPILKEIQIIGNEVTLKKVILREIRIKEGEAFNYQKFSKIQSRLMRLGLFHHVLPPEIFLATEQEGGLLIKLQEAGNSRFDGVVGYTPGTGEEKGYFTGLIDIKLGNLFGSGRSILAHWQKRDRASQDLLFHYLEPWIAGYPVNAGFGFQQLIQDSSYIERQVGLDLQLPLLENFSIIAALRKSSILPDSSASYSLAIPKSSSLSTSIGLSFDSRDDLLNPQKGLYYFTSLETGRKSNLGPPDLIDLLSIEKKVNHKRLVLDLDFFIPTFKRQLLSMSLHGRQLISSEKRIPISDLFRLGGTKSLRGYREDQFRGSIIAWINAEYRYIMGRRSRAFTFVDVGYYENNYMNSAHALKIGYGFGVRLETGLGIMGIDYGLAYGEKQGVMSGLLHVGLVNEF